MWSSVDVCVCAIFIPSAKNVSFPQTSSLMESGEMNTSFKQALTLFTCVFHENLRLCLSFSLSRFFPKGEKQRTITRILGIRFKASESFLPIWFWVFSGSVTPSHWTVKSASGGSDPGSCVGLPPWAFLTHLFSRKPFPHWNALPSKGRKENLPESGRKWLSRGVHEVLVACEARASDVYEAGSLGTVRKQEARPAWMWLIRGHTGLLARPLSASTHLLLSFDLHIRRWHMKWLWPDFGILWDSQSFLRGTQAEIIFWLAEYLLFTEPVSMCHRG